MKNLFFILLICFAQQLMAQPPADPPPPPPPPPVEEIDHNSPMIFVEQMPVYPGGDTQMHMDIMRNAPYPKEEYEKGTSCTVYVQFIVERDGTVSHVEALKTAPNIPAFTRVTLDAVKKLKPFAPGMHGGKPARVQMTIPVKFVTK
ncbi:MAG: energy transducer TonB [Flavobacteriales bacterium]|nr:energy transducer TonB [Flavobacteriales bacterium]